MTRLTQNYQLLNTLYRSHWVIRRIIDVIPEDMCKNWIKLSSQMPPDALKRFDKMARRTSLKAKILKGLKWGRLYGGAAGLILLKGQGDKLDRPLRYEELLPDCFAGLLIMDRWSGITPLSELVPDIDDPEFGLPDMYVVSQPGARGVTVHHSRIVRFTGRDLSSWEEQAETYWGASEIEHVYDELTKRDNTSHNIANLVFHANLKVILQKGQGQTLGVAPAKAQQKMIDNLEAIARVMSSMGILALDSQDKFETHQYSFGGLGEVYDRFMMDLAGAAEMPVTKLFGRSPAGMNATGEADMQNYYDAIEEKQESYLRPVLDKLLPVMCMSAFGAVPDDVDYAFNSVRRPSDKERTEYGKARTESILAAYSQGAISRRTALKELRQLAEVTDLWSNITDEDIAVAEDTIDKGETGGFGLPDDPGLVLDAEFDESKHPRGQPENGGQFVKTGGGEKENALEAERSEDISRLLGPEYTGVKGQAAIEKLLEEKKGHVRGAFQRSDIGEIDLIWGNDDIGLRHIIKRRSEQEISLSEFLSELPDVIETGIVQKNYHNGNLEIFKNGKMAIIQLEFKGNQMKFLLTAYKKHGKLKSPQPKG
jgi:phage-related protein (TIGR01555 family)